MEISLPYPGAKNLEGGGRRIKFRMQPVDNGAINLFLSSAVAAVLACAVATFLTHAMAMALAYAMANDLTCSMAAILTDPP